MNLSNYLRRRWFDFRNGHGSYLAFVMSFVNFILITYNFAIKGIPGLHVIFSNLWVFTVFFIAVYVPASILIGHWHRRNQFAVENEAMSQENWLWAWIVMYQIRLMQGKTTPKEDEEVKKYMQSILLKNKKHEFLYDKKENLV